MRKMFSQNQIVDLIQKAINSGEVIIPQELPVTTEATAGQILALDEDKEPVWKDEVEVKPIYCHPIVITNASSVLKITMLIFNNSDTAFTLSSLKDWLDEVAGTGTARIMVSGAFVVDSKLVVASNLYKNTADNEYGITGTNTSNAFASLYSASWDVLFPTGTTLYDAVNRVN